MIFKLSIRNIISNKIRTTAIIVTICLATIMLFLSLIYSYIVYQEFYHYQPQEMDYSDIVISYSQESDSRLIRMTPLNPYLHELDYAVGVLELYGTSTIRGRVQYVNLRGIKEDGLNQLNDLEYISGVDRPLKRDEIIISRSMSEELNLNIGKDILINIAGISKRFYVGKIVEDHQSFVEQGAYVIYGLESYVSEYVGGYFGGLYNKIYIKTLGSTNTELLISIIEVIPEFKGYKVGLIKDIEYIKNQSREISLPVTIGAGACVGLAILMVYLIINSGIKKRVGLISQLKSIGASDLYVFKVLVIECLIYIVIGVLMGYLLNNVLLIYVIPKVMTITIDSFYISRLYLAGILTGLTVLAVVIYPIVRSRGMSIKQSHNLSKTTLWHSNYIIIGIGLLMLVISIILASYTHLDYHRGIVGLIFSCLGCIMLIPYVLRLICSYCLKIGSNLKGVSYISINNMKSERSVANKLKIIFTGIIICSIIFSAALITEKLGTQLIDDVRGDIIVRNVRGDTDTQINYIESIDGVYDVYAYQYEKASFSIRDIDYHMHIIGVDYDRLNLIGEKISSDEVISCVMASQDSMLIDYMYYKVFKINIGDVIPITINNITHNITVGGFYQSYQYGGRTAIMNNQMMADLYGVSLYNTIILNTENDIDETVLKIRADLGLYNLVVLNKNAVFGLYFNLMDNTIAFAYYFTLLVMLVSFVSVFINVINSRQDRKLSRYQMLSLGFSRIQLTYIEVLENIVSLIVCFAIAAAINRVINLSISNIMSMSYVYLVDGITIKILLAISLIYLAGLLLISITSYYSVNKDEIVRTLKS